MDKPPERGILLLVLSYVGFISLGLPDTVLGAAWPAMRHELGLPVERAGAVLLVTTVGVVLSSMASGHMRRRWGNGVVLVVCTTLAALALLASAVIQSFPQLLVAAVIAGLGGGAIDACLNDFMARHYSARHMNWLHASWGVGASLGPAVVASVLARGDSWRLAYGLLGGVELLLMLAFVRTRNSWSDEPAVAAEVSLQPQAAHARSRVIASVLMFFAYGGVEAGAGLWASSLLIETHGTSAVLAGYAVAIYWGALCVGRFLIGAKADQWGPARVLRGAVYWSSLATLALAIPHTPTWFFIAALALLGFSLAPIYPLTMHDTPHRFGPELGARLVGYQVAACAVGIASGPWLIGMIAASSKLTVIPTLLAGLAMCVVGLESMRRSRLTDLSPGSR